MVNKVEEKGSFVRNIQSDGYSVQPDYLLDIWPVTGYL